MPDFVDLDEGVPLFDGFDQLGRGIMFGLPVGITAGTAMVETPMKLVDGSGQGIVAIEEITVDDGPDGLFAPVTDVSNAIAAGPLLGNLVFPVVQPL